jgi:hypothetical protein
MGLIRGSGLGVAIFSEHTPASTLANIFFEVGMCHVFGKPVVLAKTATAQTPSDFVRTEWVAKRESDAAFRSSLRGVFESVLGLVRYFKTMAEVALEADEIDYELAYERLKQAVLIGHDVEAVDRIQSIYETLGRANPTGTFRVAQRRLRNEIGHFLKLVTG